MPPTASKQKSRKPALAKEAQSLTQDAIDTAQRLSLDILQGGESLLPAGQGDVEEAPGQAKPSAKPGAAAPRRPRSAAPIGLKADVTPRLTQAAPAFGDVLRSIGHAVAVTQTALDEAALESLKTLAGQQVDVPILVEQTLGDDGIPTTVLIKTASVPLTSIITPSMQQVDQMTLRMDMRVESFNATSGIRFNQNMASAGVSAGSQGFGFALGMSNANVNAQFSNMSDFSSGSVMMSLDIVDRTGFQIPTPLEYGIGANVLVRLTSLGQASVTVNNAVVFERTADFAIKLVKDNGSVVNMTSAMYTVAVPPGLEFDALTAGSLKVKRFCEAATEAYLERKIFVSFGQLVKEVSVHI
ncbi:MAG: hypothetical protein ACKVYV_18895 [Limisphaerales bacterium]